MPQFLTDHLAGCRPTRPCKSCETLAFLKSKLKREDYEKFLKLLAEGTGTSFDVSRHPPPDLNRPWEPVLGPLTFRTRTSLKNDGLVTLADVVRRTAAEHRRMPNFGKKSLKELEEALEVVGLHLGMEVPDAPPSETMSPATTE